MGEVERGVPVWSDTNGVVSWIIFMRALNNWSRSDLFWAFGKLRWFRISVILKKKKIFQRIKFMNFDIFVQRLRMFCFVKVARILTLKCYIYMNENFICLNYDILVNFYNDMGEKNM